MVTPKQPEHTPPEYRSAPDIWSDLAGFERGRGPYLAPPAKIPEPQPLSDLERFLERIWEPGDVREVRSPKHDGYNTAAGYFDDPAKLVEAVAGSRLDGRANVYVTINPVAPALLARAANRIDLKAKTTTADKDVVRRRWLFVDVDTVRPAGISATEDERALAQAVANAIAAYLRDLGWPDPVVAMSGNGYALFYPIDLPNDEASKRLVEGVLAHLAERCDTDGAKVDSTVSNAARIVGLVGTMKVKGDSTPDRPHRRSQLLRDPVRGDVVTAEQLAALAPDPQPKAGCPAASITIAGDRMAAGWVKDMLDAGGITYREIERKGRTWYRLDECPFHPEDDLRGDCGVGEDPVGKGLGHCFHNRGAGKGWQEFKAALGLRIERFTIDFGGPALEPPPPEPVAWPAPPAEAAFHGVLGDITRAVERHTEADPVGVLGTLLAMFGAACGGSRSFYQGSQQRTNLSLLLVGGTGFGGRKGTALDVGRAVFRLAYPELEKLWLVGAASGEAITGHLARKDDLDRPRWLIDERVLIVETEFGRLLTVMNREGSTLSAVLRNAWDGVAMGYARARDEVLIGRHHVSLLGHITPVELRSKLTDTDAANGFANRLLFLAVRRTRLVPFPQSPDTHVAAFVDQLRAAIESAGRPAELRFTEAAEDRWESFYAGLALSPRLGLAGALTGRHEAQVARLALVYALADQAPAIDVEHLEAAIALAEYAARSVVHAFGDSTGNRHADQLRAMLGDGPVGWDEAKRSLGLRTAADMAEVVAVLTDAGIAEVLAEASAAGRGRPRRLIAIKGVKGVKDARGARTNAKETAA